MSTKNKVENSETSTPVLKSEINTKKTKPARRKPVYFWTNAEVVKWLWRQCNDIYTLYGNLFSEHDITGRTLVRMNEINLEKLGITNKDHRDTLWQEILKLRLRTDILEMRDLELKALSKYDGEF